MEFLLLYIISWRRFLPRRASLKVVLKNVLSIAVAGVADTRVYINLNLNLT